MKEHYRVWIEKLGCWLPESKSTLYLAIEYAKTHRDGSDIKYNYTIQRNTVEDVHTVFIHS